MVGLQLTTNTQLFSDPGKCQGTPSWEDPFSGATQKKRGNIFGATEQLRTNKQTKTQRQRESNANPRPCRCWAASSGLPVPWPWVWSLARFCSSPKHPRRNVSHRGFTCLGGGTGVGGGNSARYMYVYIYTYIYIYIYLYVIYI